MLLLVIVIFVVASAILGYRVISRVPPLLYTPLMSGMNALSGITVLGSLTVYATAPQEIKAFAAVAIVMAMINVAGGYWVTDRMLAMFKHNKDKLEETGP